MDEAWEAQFNQEGPPSLLGDAKVRLLILPEVHACVCACGKGGSALRLMAPSDSVCAVASRALNFCIRGCKKQRGLVETRGGDLLF